MPGTTYKLLLYLLIDSNLNLVDIIFSDDKEELVSLALERKSNNPEYIAIISSYSLIDTEILKERNEEQNTEAMAHIV
jgi:hypothetical protein